MTLSGYFKVEEQTLVDLCILLALLHEGQLTHLA